MKKFIKSLEKNIRDNFEVNNIIIVDNSHKHRKHKFFDKKKYHLYIEIESNYLKNLKTLDAHRLIMKLLGENMKSKIHALEIKIK